jgi:hypothetical protein
MPNGTEPGSLIDDTEDVYRAILSPDWWPDGMNRPSSAAFDDPVFSVDVKSRTTPRETAARFRNVTRIAEFNCGRARGIGFETRDELDPNQPDNLAHAHVYFLGYDAFSNKERKKKARRLAEICIEVAIPASGSEVVTIQGVATLPLYAERKEVDSGPRVLAQNPAPSDAGDQRNVKSSVTCRWLWSAMVLAVLLLIVLWLMSK